MPVELCGFPGEVGENGLRDILRKLRVAVDLAQGGGIDEIDMSPDQFLKGRLGAVVRIPPEQFSVCSVHSPI